MRENTAVENKKADPVARRKKLAIAATGTVAGMAGIAVLAAWSGTALTETDFSSGSLGVQISVDGGKSWVQQEENGVASSTLQWANSGSGEELNGQEGIYPGDELSTTLQIKPSDNTTRNVDLSEIRVTTNEDDPIDMEWDMTVGTGYGVSGVVVAEDNLSDETYAAPSVQDSGDSLTIRPDEHMTITITAEVGSHIDQSSLYGVDWAFDAEQSGVDVGSDFEYEVTESGVTVSGYEGESGVGVVVPESVTIYGETYPVTQIGTSAFRGNALTGVEIPDSVTEIGSYAFFDNNLTSVEIPDSVTGISLYSFSDNNLTSVEIPDSLTDIPSLAFTDNNLTSVTFAGAAPSLREATHINAPFDNSDDLTLYYHEEYSDENVEGGFTSPTWKGYNAEPLA